VYFGIHIKPVDEKTDSDHHYAAIEERVPPVRQGVVQKPWHGDEKYREKTDPQQTKNKNNKYFIVHVVNPLNPPYQGEVQLLNSLGATSHLPLRGTKAKEEYHGYWPHA
jgi:hypothetical protein